MALRGTITGPEPWQTQYAWLIALLEAEAVAGGSLFAAAGGVEVDISRVSPPDSKRFPAIGVQWVAADSIPAAAGVREIQSTFSLCVANDLVYADQDIARTAKESIENLLNDQNGHGLLPLLRVNRDFGGTANLIGGPSIEAYYGDSADSQSEISARAYVKIITSAEQFT